MEGLKTDDREFTDLITVYHRITDYLIREQKTITTMESCTGGLIGTLLSDREGASGVVSGGFFTYSNEAKIRAGVPRETIGTYGVYSKQTALGMAEACLTYYGTDIGIGVTGSFGTKDPANADSVPGEIHIGVVCRGGASRHAVLVIDPTDRWQDRMKVAFRVAELLEEMHTGSLL